MCGTTVAVAIAKPSSRQQRASAPVSASETAPRAGIWLRVLALDASTAPTLAASLTAETSAPSAIMRATLAFNAGRITSYVIAGVIVSGVAGSIAERVVMNEIAPIRLALFAFGQLLVIATGFYIAGATNMLAPFERAGRWLWTRLQPQIGPRLRAHFHDGQAQPFAFGLLWGWIPCGLVYGTLATAMASGSMQYGALIMAGFGLGTLPAMFAASTAAAPMRRLAQIRGARVAAGAVIIALGIAGLSKLPQLADFAALARLCFGNP
jgi:sulfite exporter TauE/SafE